MVVGRRSFVNVNEKDRRWKDQRKKVEQNNDCRGDFKLKKFSGSQVTGVLLRCRVPESS